MINDTKAGVGQARINAENSHEPEPAPLPPTEASEKSPRPAFIARFWPELAGVAVALLWCGAVAFAAIRLPPDRVLMGFTHVDQPVYYACAREYFENGNGLFAASPYSSDPASPRLYSHLGFLIAGWVWRLTGASFASIDFWARVLFGCVMMALAARVAFRLAGESRYRWVAVLATVAGGGLAWAAALGDLLVSYAMESDDPSFRISLGQWLARLPESVTEAEGGYGEWGAALCRSLPMTPETFYHAIFFAAVLAFLSARRVLAVFLVFLAWWAHPFTGLELGVILTVGCLVEWFACRGATDNHHANRWALCAAATAAVTAAFLAWYLVHLPRFPEHASVEASFRGFHNPMQASWLLLAFGLFALLPLGLFLSAGFAARLRESREARFTVVWLVCVVALVFHDRLAPLVPTIQPMHFMRGYLYVPLAVLGALGLAGVSRRLHWRPGVMFAVGAVVVAIHLPDNLFAIRALVTKLQSEHSSFSISRRAADTMSRLAAVSPAETVTCLAVPGDVVHAMPMIPVLTRHRPLMVHQFNTPYWDRKRDAVTAWKGTPTAGQLDELGVGLLIVSESHAAESLGGIPSDRLTTLSAEAGVAIIRVTPP